MKQNISFILLLLFICCCLAGTIYPPTNKVKVYRALLTQGGTAAPVATVLENTLGATITWGYVGVGEYSFIISAGTFPALKTAIKLGSNLVTADTAPLLYTYRTSTTRFDLYSRDAASGSPQDLQLEDTLIEILVYP